MIVRLADWRDFDAICDLGAANVAETMPGDSFDPGYVAATFERYMKTANPTFYVVEKDSEIVGFAYGWLCGYDYRAGLFAVQKVLYVTPANRGSRAAVLLIRELIAWAERCGCDRIEGGNDNSFNSERTARFLGHFGFEQVGCAMRLNLEPGGGRKKRRKRSQAGS
jgi:GNAT superfamily N-acetyltransferase